MHGIKRELEEKTDVYYISSYSSLTLGDMYFFTPEKSRVNSLD